MISCWWSSDIYSVLVGIWTDNEAGKILKTCHFNNKYFWGTITTVFEVLIKIIYDSEVTVKLQNCCWFWFSVSYFSIMLKWNVRPEDTRFTVWEIVDPSQMKMTFHFFPKSGVLRKTSLTL